MSTRDGVFVVLLTLGMAACGSGEDTGPSGASQAKPGTTGQNEGAASTEPGQPDPEEVLEGSDDHSRDVWALIQEEHSQLTDQQQRSLQACAELALQDGEVAVAEAVEQCRREMEEMAEEQEETGDQESGEG